MLFRRTFPTLLIALGVLLAWEGYCRAAGVSALVLPAPSDVARGLWLNRADIGRHALSTLSVTATGFGLSVCFAFAVSVALHPKIWSMTSST